MTFLVCVRSSISVSLGRRLQKRPAVCHVVPASQLNHLIFDFKFYSFFSQRDPFTADREAAGNVKNLIYEPHGMQEKDVLGV